MDGIIYPACLAEQIAFENFLVILLPNLESEIPFAYRAAEDVHE